jgi:hypothetical protein
MNRSIDSLIAICMAANPGPSNTSQEDFEDHHGCFALVQICEVLETMDLVREVKRGWELTPKMQELLIELDKAGSEMSLEATSTDDAQFLIESVFIDGGWEGEEDYFEFGCRVLEALGLVVAVGEGSWKPTTRLKRLARHRVVDLRRWRTSQSGPFVAGRWLRQ